MNATSNPRVGHARTLREVATLVASARAPGADDAASVRALFGGDAFLVVPARGDRTLAQLERTAAHRGEGASDLEDLDADATADIPFANLTPSEPLRALGPVGLPNAEVFALANAQSIGVGRARTCDVVIADASVSSLHSELENVDGAWRVHDARSKHGTFVDGARAPARGDGDPLAVKPGSIVKAGSVEITFADATLIVRLVSMLPP